MFPPSSNSAARVAGAAARVSAACGCSTGPATRTLSTAETVSVMHDREARLPDSTSTAHLYAYDRCCKHFRPYGSDRTSGRPSPPAYLSTKNPPRSCCACLPPTQYSCIICLGSIQDPGELEVCRGWLYF